MYEAYYKLSHRPFQLSPDARFFYASRGHKRAMSYLRYGLDQGEGFIVITGDVGTGKTTLVQSLFAELSEQNIVAARLVTTQLEAEDTLRMVAASFGLTHEGAGKASLLTSLEGFLTQCAQEGKRVLLVVDEAQNLPPSSLEELRMLSNFQAGDQLLLQSFLLGQEEFRNTLQAPGLEQLRQRVIAAYHLKPLDADETKSYIEHRLRLVGWAGDPLLTDAAYAEIHRHSYGIPRRVNALCDRLLLFGFLETRHELDETAVQTVVEELHEETAAVSAPTTAIPPASSHAPVGPGAGADVGPSADPIWMQRLEQRVQAMERAIADLDATMRREQALLRKTILFDAQGD